MKVFLRVSSWKVVRNGLIFNLTVDEREIGFIGSEILGG
jgi:hypothetical protein